MIPPADTHVLEAILRKATACGNSPTIRTKLLSYMSVQGESLRGQRDDEAVRIPFLGFSPFSLSLRPGSHRAGDWWPCPSFLEVSGKDIICFSRDSPLALTISLLGGRSGLRLKNKGRGTLQRDTPTRPQGCGTWLGRVSASCSAGSSLRP